MELKLNKEQAIFVFNALENTMIKGKDSTKVVQIFEKLNSYIIALHENETMEADKKKIAEASGVDPNLLVQE